MSHIWLPTWYCKFELNDCVCRGKVLGVVGYGDIGQETANLARAFKMKIIALRRRKELSQHDKDLNLKVNFVMSSSNTYTAAV